VIDRTRRRTHAEETPARRLVRYANRHDGRARIVRTRHRPASFVLIEVVAAALGFAGLGWLSSGRALLGVCLLIASPIVVWIVIPITMSLLRVVSYTPAGPWPMLAYLGTSALVSGTFLARDLLATRRDESSA